MAALLSESPAVVAALLDAGANPNAWNEGGSTPLHLAAHQPLAVIAALLDAGADLQARDEGGMTPLHMAALLSESPAVIAALLDAGADLQARTAGGMTPLHAAAGASESPAVIAALLDAGADLQARTAGGMTPLHAAAGASKLPGAVEALLAAGADPGAQDGNGKTPWDHVKANEALKGTAVYWRLNDAHYQAPRTKDEPLTLLEVDALRAQIQRCWIVRAGARYGGELVVTLRVFLNPDGSLRSEPKIVDEARFAADPDFHAAAESALRAVLKCEPFKMPVAKYHRWREIELTFDPREMLR